LKPIAITIPSYWKRPLKESSQKDDFIFDHPTALDGPDTLTKTLTSLIDQDNRSFVVIILTATVCPEINQAAENRVSSIISHFKRHFPIIQFSEYDLNFVNNRISKSGKASYALNLDSYPNIRNCQLLIPAVCDCNAIIAIDDDETVLANYVDIALEELGGYHHNRQIDGKTGFYYHEWGDFLVKEPEGVLYEKNLFRRKEFFINNTFRQLQSAEERFVTTPIALGGNMVFSKALFNHVPFDPQVTRGEDIDYLINSRCLGYHWFFDKNLRIDHFPPPGNAAIKLQEDVIRFMYERQKLKLSQNNPDINTITAEELCPYPGEYLKEGIKKDALEALNNRRRSSQDDAIFVSTHRIMEIGNKKAEKASEYFDFARQWSDLIKKLKLDRELQRYFYSKFESQVP
jgi:hypothetical protein